MKLWTSALEDRSRMGRENGCRVLIELEKIDGCLCVAFTAEQQAHNQRVCIGRVFAEEFLYHAPIIMEAIKRQ